MVYDGEHGTIRRCNVDDDLHSGDLSVRKYCRDLPYVQFIPTRRGFGDSFDVVFYIVFQEIRIFHIQMKIN